MNTYHGDGGAVGPAGSAVAAGPDVGVGGGHALHDVGVAGGALILGIVVGVVGGEGNELADVGEHCCRAGEGRSALGP